MNYRLSIISSCATIGLCLCQLCFGADTPQTRANALLKFSRQIDELHAKVEEWGTMSIAPIIFAPGSTNGPTGKVAPFALTEGTTPITLASLYGDYNLAQGQSLFASRTQTKITGAYGTDTNEVAGQVDQRKLDIFNTNVDRATAADEQKRTLTQQQYDEARSRQKAAREKAEEATSALTAAKQRQAIATANVTAATSRVQQESAKPDANKDPVALNSAQLALIQANQEKAVADAAVTAASDDKTRADAALATADNAANSAETAYTNALNASINIPSNGPSATSPTNGLPNLDTADSFLGKVSGASGSSALATLGQNALPTLVGNVNASDNKGAFSPLARINSAAAALTVKNILAFLGNPQGAGAFADRRILFGVTSLSVDPGWRTKRGFKGVINAGVSCPFAPAHADTVLAVLRDETIPLEARKRIALDYQSVLSPAAKRFFEPVKAMEVSDLKRFVETRKMNDGDQVELLVHAVSPMVDSQNLDLASSIARQDEVALFLSASMAQVGSAEAAKLFTSWARLRRKDVATRSTLAVANSFTLGGGYFGFEIGTRLRGLDDDDARGNKAAQTLDRQTFPVLLILGMDADDTRPRFSFDDKGRIQVWEPQVEVAYSTLWSRTNHRWWTSLLAKRRPSKSYEEILNLGAAKAALRSAFEKGSAPAPGAMSDAVAAIRSNMSRDYDALVRSLHGANFTLTLPAGWLVEDAAADWAALDAPLGGLQLQPTSLQFRDLVAPATLVITGANLQQVDPARVAVLGSGAQKTVTGARLLGSNALALDLQATDLKGGSIRVALPHKNDQQATLTAPIAVTVQDSANSALNAWALSEYVGSGTENAGKWSGAVELILTGVKLDQLDPPVLEGATGVASYSIKPGTDGRVAVVKVDLQNLPLASGQAFLSLIVTGSASKLYSAPFKYRLVKTN